jgi:uncharacterized protein (TIGR03435 family)
MLQTAVPRLGSILQLLPVIGIAMGIVRVGRTQDQMPVPPKSEFDVASIKASRSTASWYTVSPVKNGQFTARNITAKQLVAMAYQIDEFRVSGGAKWLDSDRFDVDAKVEAPVPSNDLHVPLQSLLASRFQLKVHRDTRELSVLALVVAGKDPKFPPAGHRDCSTDAKPRTGCSGIRFAGRGLTAEYVSMPGLVRALTGIVGTPVLDETGLQGAYDFRLDFVDTPEASVPDAGTPPARQTNLNTDWVFAALPQQLGLKLVPRKAQLETLVIDWIEKPSAN